MAEEGSFGVCEAFGIRRGREEALRKRSESNLSDRGENS